MPRTDNTPDDVLRQLMDFAMSRQDEPSIPDFNQDYPTAADMADQILYGSEPETPPVTISIDEASFAPGSITSRVNATWPSTTDTIANPYLHGTAEYNDYNRLVLNRDIVSTDADPYQSPLRSRRHRSAEIPDRFYREAPLDSWMTGTGEIIKITELETPHLLSILSLLHKDRERAPQQRNKMISLEKEVVRRFTM